MKLVLAVVKCLHIVIYLFIYFMMEQQFSIAKGGTGTAVKNTD